MTVSSTTATASMASMNGVLQYYGTYNGISLQQLMQSEVQALQTQDTPIENQINSDNQTIASWGTLKTSLSKLTTATQALENFQTQNQAVSYSQSGYATVTATSAANSGNYTLSIQNLATAEQDLSNAQTSATSALNDSGTFSINGKSISVTSTNSLTDLSNAINAAGAGVTANIIGTQMVITANSTGAANAITYSDPNGILSGIGILNTSGTANNQIQSAKNANYTLDGVALSSSSNTINNATNGIDVTLNQVTSSPVTVSVSQNNTTLESLTQTFVNDYNSAVKEINTLTGKGGTLEGKSVPNQVLNNMESAMSVNQYSGTNMLSMYDTGIQLDQNAKDGTVTYDASTLTNALNSNPQQVVSLLTKMATQLYSQLNTVTQSGGTIDGEVSSENQTVTNLNNQLTQNQAMEKQQEQMLTQQLTQFQTQMSQLQMQKQYITAQISGSSGSSSSGG